MSKHKTTSPNSFQVIQKVYDHFLQDVEPHFYKLTLLKYLLLYADLNEMSIQEDFEDVRCGLDQIIGDSLTALQIFQDNLSTIYREVGHE